MNPYPTPELEQAPRSWTPANIIGTVLVIGVIVAVLFAALRVSPNDATLARWKAEELEAKRAAEYAKLEEQVQTSLGSASEKLKAFDSAADALAGDVQKATKISLLRITQNPNDTPTEIDVATQKDADFRTAWNDLLNAFPDRQARDALWNRYRAVERNHQAKALSYRDLDELERLIRSADEGKKRIDQQPQNVVRVRKTLSQRRIEDRFGNSERSTP